ncbi:NUDIX domain-containing protein [Leptospira noguchii]|uniref:NUDIX domain protein n=2 Tax=Leptospira noguchii TaxID=28182 RepID=T0H317_9LEPT|nr:NUDIX domain-containing protein [Leptospira noguchii]EMO52836.1 NUDIX domain protein [Leptospira noguchii]EQA73796.1 NUDIX domain protein [Leptospira noguchii serovar Panama str. CZ214]MCH1911156.1 NUDIX domain-containing protein [Leptospira noguchii]MCH1914183.1 NUDIX domain-containing protein [Leptospira noguchii]UOG64181.1 NUDIX domain-containing protein [Leptospira noguchii]
MSKHGFFQITQKLFLRKGDELLILRDRKSGLGDLPGGRMNDNEFFEDWGLSMQREIEEELGLQVQIRVSPKPLFIHKHRVNEGNFPCIIIAYHADYLGGDIILSDEHDYIAWENVQTYEPSPLFTEYMLDAVNLYLKEYASLVH